VDWQKHSLCSYKVAEVTALQNYSHREPPAYILQSKNSLLFVVAGIGIHGILDLEWMFYSDAAQLTERDYIKSHNNRY
jgi:hypothetical protein